MNIIHESLQLYRPSSKASHERDICQPHNEDHAQILAVAQAFMKGILRYISQPHNEHHTQSLAIVQAYTKDTLITTRYIKCT